MHKHNLPTQRLDLIDRPAAKPAQRPAGTALAHLRLTEIINPSPWGANWPQLGLGSLYRYKFLSRAVQSVFGCSFGVELRDETMHVFLARYRNNPSGLRL